MTDVTAAQEPSSEPAHLTVDQVFRSFHPWTRTWISRHLHRSDSFLADDLASEVFARLVATYGDRPEIRTPKPLLAKVARCVISDYFRGLAETPVDFADPAQAHRAPKVPAAESIVLARVQASDMLTDRPTAPLAGVLDQIDRLFALVVAA